MILEIHKVLSSSSVSCLDKHATEHGIYIKMTSSPAVITRSFSAEEKKMSRLSDLIVSGFTPSLFWCGCSVCSPAPAVCSLPFNNLPLAKSLTLTGPRQHCLHFYTRRWETCGLVRASRAPIPAAGFVLQRSDVTSHLRSNPAWAPSDSRQCRHRCCWLAFQFSLHHEQTLFFEWWHFFLRLICWRLGDIS